MTDYLWTNQVPPSCYQQTSASIKHCRLDIGANRVVLVYILKLYISHIILHNHTQLLFNCQKCGLNVFVKPHSCDAHINNSCYYNWSILSFLRLWQDTVKNTIQIHPDLHWLCIWWNIQPDIFRFRLYIFTISVWPKQHQLYVSYSKKNWAHTYLHCLGF